ncbi:hypothetical protein [Sphingobium xenophagum]|uniref:Phage tail tape measure protein domain-containing protein n=1 Tax=Sphingobium xenophagum TaxID=121428 RepID=A0A401IZB4_SPHXE|nr:hypothetical protein [Sphingobium xenophagum]GBH29676.1 hypothetical protein MBESOW_P0930 [Sphingobium xenophagum]
MASTRIGNMRVNVGADTAQFDKAMSDVQRRLSGVGKNFETMGGKLAGLGSKMSLALTAPLAGITAAFIGAGREIAGSVKEIEKSAALSGASFEGFQRMAFAAKSVGVESDKLTDILKDTTERFGEFAATGGGELKDFFDNVAPKVGLTAEAFKNLSGPDALQAYYNALSKAGLNQQQMTYYMEALASDATELIPLLAKNGQLMGEMGDKAAIIKPEDAERLKQFTKANQQMDAAFQRLTITLVNSGLLETVTKLIEKFANWTSNLAQNHPEMLKWGAAITGIGAALGPVLIGVGSLVSGIGKMIPLVTKLGPVIWTVTKAFAGMAFTPVGAVILGVAAAVGAVYLAWKNWDKITAIVSNLYNGVKTWIGDKMGAIFDWLGKKLTAVGDWFYKLYDRVVGHSYIPDMVDEIGQHMARLQGNMVDPTEKATQSAAEKFRDMAGQISGVMDSLYPEIAALRAELASLALLEGDPNTPLDAIMRQRQRVADARARADAEASPALERPSATMPGEIAALPGIPLTIPALEQMNELGLSLRDTFDRMGSKTGDALANITDGLINAVIPALNSTQAQAEAAGASLGQMGQGLTSLFSGIFGRKAGGILGAIGTVGLKIAGFRESGGPVSSGKAYVVGEKRPEIFVPETAGMILPDLSSIGRARVDMGGYVGAGGHMRERDTRILVQVEEGALFRPVVTQIAGGVAAPLAAQAAVGGSQGAQTAISRRQSRRLA